MENNNNRISIMETIATRKVHNSRTVCGGKLNTLFYYLCSDKSCVIIGCNAVSHIWNAESLHYSFSSANGNSRRQQRGVCFPSLVNLIALSHTHTTPTLSIESLWKAAALYCCLATSNQTSTLHDFPPAHMWIQTEVTAPRVNRRLI